MPSGTQVVYDIIARDRASSTFNSVAKSAQRNAEAMAKLGRNMQSLGRDMSRHITLPVVAASAAAVKMAVDFNSAMTKIQTQAGGSASDVKSLSTQVLSLKNAQQGPVQLAQAMYHLKSVGLDNADAMKALKAASDLAAVGGSNLEDTTNSLAGAWRTGIKGAKDFQEASATLNAVVGAGNMRMEDLVEALGTGVLPAAKTFGLSLKDVGASLALFTDESVPADVAATRLRMTFSLMGAPSGAAVKALHTIGLTSTSLASDMRQPNGLITAIGDLRSHLKDSGLTAVQQAAVISKAFGGGRSGSAVMSMVNNFDVLKKKEQQVTDSLGKYSSAVAAQAKTPGAQFAELKSNLSRSAVLFGNQLLPSAIRLVDWLSKCADRIASWSAGTKDAVIKFGLAAAALGPVLTISGKIVETMALAKKAMIGFGLAADLANPALLAVTAGLALGGTALFKFIKNQEDEKAAAQGFKDALDGMTGKINAQTAALNKNVQASAIKELADKGAYDRAKQLGIRFNDVTQASLGNADAQKRVQDALSKVQDQQASATIHAAGYSQGLDKNGQAAQRLAKDIFGTNKGLTAQIAATRQAKQATADANVATKSLRDAQSKGATSAEGLSLALRAQKKALADEKAALDRSRTALIQNANAAISASNDEIAYKQTIKDATDAVEKNRHTLNLNSQAGRDNQTALNNMADAALKWIQDAINSGASTESLMKKTKAARTEFINTAMQMGDTRAQAKKLADQYGLVPKQIATKVQTPGMTATQARIKALQDQIAALKDKDISIGFHVAANGKVVAGSGGPHGAMQMKANGGILRGPGTGTSDDLPIMASNGEYVLRAAAVRKLGVGRLDYMNQTGMIPAYANGGQVLNIHTLFPSGVPAAIGRLLSGAESSLVSQAKKSLTPTFPGLSGGTSGANQKLGLAMMLAAGWPASQWPALKALWTRESGWNASAVNPSSGAYGIPQALGHGHPFALGDAAAQIAWGLSYIRSRYGSPGAAWGHETAAGWYRNGGIVRGQGTGTSDSVPAWLSVGEAVIPANMVQHFANGGVVGSKGVVPFTPVIPERLFKAYGDTQVVLAKLATQIPKAVDKFTQALQTRNQYASSVASGLNGFGAVTTGVSGGNLKSRLADIRRFGADLKQLQRWGLDRASYQAIVDAGIDGGGLATAEALIHSGMSGIQQTNMLERQIHAASAAIGTGTSRHLYQGQVNSARHLVNSLRTRDAKAKADSKAQAEDIAQAIMREYRKDKHNGKDPSDKDLAKALRDALESTHWTASFDNKSLKLHIEKTVGQSVQKASTHV